MMTVELELDPTTANGSSVDPDQTAQNDSVDLDQTAENDK